MSFDVVSNLLKLLKQSNPWWDTGRVPESLVKPYKRQVFESIIGLTQSETLRRNVMLQGPRGGGKTTLVYQMIQHLLNHGTSPRSILYVSYDHPLSKLCSTELILEMFYGNFADGEKTYIFFDEIQYASDWNEYLTEMYAQEPQRNVLCTCSALPNNEAEANEDDANAIVWSYYYIGTLSFYEYCTYKNVLIDFTANKSDVENNELEELFNTLKASNIDFNEHGLINPDKLQLLSQSALHRLFMEYKPLQKVFYSYLMNGGYPILLDRDEYDGTDYDTCSEIIEKALKSDIPSIFKTRTPQLLEKIFLYLTYNSGTPINLSAMSKCIDDTPAVTLSHYIEYLCQANLIYMIPPISFDGEIIQKPKYEFFSSDTAVRRSITLNDRNSVLTDNNELKLLLKTALNKHLCGTYARSQVKIGYKKPTQSNPGIDTVIETKYGRTLIDFRFEGNDSLLNRKYFAKCTNGNNSKIISSYILTKELEDVNLFLTRDKKKILQLPIYIYLYLLG